MKSQQSVVGHAPPAMFTSSAAPPPRQSHETLWDGTAVIVRDLEPDDLSAVLALADDLSGDELYLRFFTYHPKYLAEWAHSVTEPAPGSVALGVFAGDALLAVGNYLATSKLRTAEIAIVVAHHNHHRGIATALLKQLGEHAKNAGTQRLVADVLVQNRDMRQVIADAGWPYTRRRNDEVLTIEVDLTNTSRPDLAMSARPAHSPLSVTCSAR
ncbi:MAG: GNAT family N-acetyltransferase [Mycobacterium sp.]|nr:GNAT family N-acetyltransferase [Mycobacterium sp.]